MQPSVAPRNPVQWMSRRASVAWLVPLASSSPVLFLLLSLLLLLLLLLLL